MNMLNLKEQGTLPDDIKAANSSAPAPDVEMDSPDSSSDSSDDHHED